MKKCNQCNAMNNDNGVFCTNCGNTLSIQQATQQSEMTEASQRQPMPSDQAAEFINNM